MGGRRASPNWRLRSRGPGVRTPGAAQGNRLSCRDQEGRRGSEEAVPGPSVFPSGDPGVSGDFWGSLRELRKENTWDLAAIGLQPLPAVSPKGAPDVKTTGYWPGTAKMQMRGTTSVSPDSCIFPHIEKH